MTEMTRSEFCEELYIGRVFLFSGRTVSDRDSNG